MSSDAYTGIKRRKQTPWSVKFGDALVSRLIAIGGIGTIAAILLVVLVLLGTALPLFRQSESSEWYEFSAPTFRHFGIDEHGLVMWGMKESGDIEVRCIENGELLASYPRDGDTQITSSHLSIDHQTLVVGLNDGSFQVTKTLFDTQLVSPTVLDPAVEVSQEHPVSSHAGAVFQWFDARGVRRTELAKVSWSEPLQIGDGPLVAIDYLPDASSNRLSRSTQAYALAICGNELVLADITGKKNLAGKVTEKVTSLATPIERRSQQDPLSIMLINGVDHALIAWSTGTLDRFSLAGGRPKYIESQSGAVDGGKITCAAPLLARQTLLCGVDDGRLLGWMVTRPADLKTTSEHDDGYRLTLAHEVKISDKPLIAIGSSEQSHVAVTCDSDSRTALVYVSTDRLLCSASSTLSSEIRSVGLDPTGRVLMAATDNSVGLSTANIGYPEASYSSFFRRVWYEGHDRPKYIWQSSSGNEKSEIKLSLMPLIFGTLKATVYAMLISVPLALLSAIYTSEFLSSSARTRIKPVVELMASLPSVVLGYVAALVVAPFLQEHLMVVLVGLLVLPLTFVFAGNLWNLLPLNLLVRMQHLRLVAMIICLPVAFGLTLTLAEIAEPIWFAGDIVQWIGSGQGSATGGWMLLLIPSMTLLATMILMGPLADRTRTLAVKRTPRSFAIFALIRLLCVAVAVVAAAWLVGLIFSSLDLDLRDSLFNSYQDRNALLVGAALGFCVIPIIYTISDDALQAVPQQLRSASLGCGATPWQTTMRVVVPAAMSGLFSAVMIGLGRAVGETMVVLMAAGNTPVMEWNPFSGFRTLSATLATELPEAAKGSTHFRTLFLAALLLFFFTLIANTVAEFVRIRFRKRASQL